ncbi:MAG TPA: citrate transporter [Candidatus Merdiplasma excrementigallinarum]|uniref:Citrate transporter n=1 Tax=Candidatus Merdiplasma excrementigallinarum TaxID=2840864 RepID=A0A9D1NZW2_9FIRM|nr:citrate transporter [Candidatus Merdiplasma excrementigallinarum]
MIAQILAVVIFLAMFILIITEVFERHIVTLGCALLSLVLVFGLGLHSMDAVIRTLNVQSIFTPGFWYTAGQAGEASAGINWETIIFIAGMMIMVEGMARVGFFRWLCMRIAGLVHYQVIPIFITFMVLSFGLAMFIDSITVILFLAAVTIELSQLLKFQPIPMILAEIFCANLGGSATMCGDPPNIIIGTSLGFSFADFITNTGLIALISLVAVVIYFYVVFKKELLKGAVTERDPSAYPDPREAITSRKGFAASTVIFLCAVVLLVTHAQTGLTVSFIGVLIGAVTLLAAGKDAVTLLKRVDYKTLLFFIGLFVVVGSLEETGILNVLAGVIGTISGGDVRLMIAIIIWLSAIASAFIDNIPFAATMIPVISNLSAAQGVDLSILAWTLALGTDIGGSATPIGASANVVGIATAAKEGHMIRWGKYCRYMAPATVIVVVISMVMIYVRYL